ncbi:MAG: phage tail tape measure protein [Actinomycetota bacterium]
MIQDYAKGMEEAAQKTRTVGTEAERLAQKKQAFTALGTAGVAMGGLIAAGIGVAVARFADFDEAMSSVQAATHASSDEMGLLRNAAIDAGASTVFSATEAAAAIEELAKAGVSTSDILGGGLAGALDLASAGGLGVAEAAGIAATSLKQFNLDGSDMSHVADLLAAGAGKAMGDVSDLSQALNQAGLVSQQTGLSIEETTAGLAAFAEQGLLGSDAGTSFKSMLQRLTPQSAEAQARMDELGISAYDASGNFVGLAEFAGNLQGALSDLTPEQRNSAMATIFGSDAVRAAGVLYSQGEKGIRDWTSAVSDQGYAAQTARIRLDNLKGDIEELGGAMETALISTGSTANDTLRTMAQALTGLVGMYNDLPESAQATVMAVGGVTAAVALSGGTALLAVPKWLEMKATLEASQMSMGRVASKAIGAGFALGGLFAIVGTLAAEHQQAQMKAKAYADTLEAGTRKITEATRELAQEGLAAKDSLLGIEFSTSAYEDAERLGVSMGTVTDAAIGNADALAEVNAAIEKTIAGYQSTDKESRTAYTAALSLKRAMEDEADAIARAGEMAALKAQEDRDAADAAQGHEDAVRGLEGGAGDATAGIDKLSDAIRGFASTELDARAATRELESAYDDLQASIDANGNSLKIGTEEGRANQAAIDDLATAVLNASAATLDQTGSQEAANDVLQKGRDRLIDMLKQFGITGEKAEAYADKLGLIPENVKTAVELTGDEAAALKLRNLQERLDAIDGYKRITLEAFTVGKFDVSIPGQAAGGPVVGPGPKGVDSELRMLAPGEHVITAEEVDAAGGHSAVEAWRSMLTGAGSSYALTADSPECVMQIPSAMRGRSKGEWS